MQPPKPHRPRQNATGRRPKQPRQQRVKPLHGRPQQRPSARPRHSARRWNPPGRLPRAVPARPLKPGSPAVPGLPPAPAAPPVPPAPPPPPAMPPEVRPVLSPEQGPPRERSPELQPHLPPVHPPNLVPPPQPPLQQTHPSPWAKARSSRPRRRCPKRHAPPAPAGSSGCAGGWRARVRSWAASSAATRSTSRSTKIWKRRCWPVTRATARPSGC